MPRVTALSAWINPARGILTNIFLKIIKMLVVPIVFFSLLTGVANLNDISSIGRIGIKTICLYLITTLFAITLSLFIGYIINPGEEINISISNESINIKGNF